MSEFNLKPVLNTCQKSAGRGYRIASSQYVSLRNSLREAEEKINETSIAFSSSPAYFSSATDLLSEQLIEIQNNLNELSFSFNDDLDKLHENLKQFSVTLFGRTTAGKSTLMEILTNGDGSSIGTGAQRTTKDVRKYTWNGLVITDVPGIGAFEGKEDEVTAFEAAKTGDLILFLISSDGPQYIEAECFSRIVELGKPVICILNVKTAIPENRSQKMILRDIEKKFDEEGIRNLIAIKNQFYAYAEMFGQDWRNIPMVFTHLKAAFICQQTKDKAFSSKLYDASRIEKLKDTIIQAVRKKGEFYRVKTFVDIISGPMLQTMENLIAQSLTNSIQSATIRSKKEQLEQWEAGYKQYANKLITLKMERIQGDLHAEIASFAELHYDDKNADRAWERVLRSKGIEGQCQTVMTLLDEQCNDKLKEVSRELTSELGYISNLTSNRALRMHTIVDGRKIWNWGAIAIGGALTIGSIVCGMLELATIATPLGIGAAVVAVIGTIGTQFFKSRSKKEYAARRRLEEALKENVKKNCYEIDAQMRRSLAGIVQKIDMLLKEIDRIDNVVSKLADTQRQLAWKLDDHLMALNQQIVNEALLLSGAKGLEYHIKATARIPGNMNCLMLYDGVIFPDEEYQKLRDLIGERVILISESKNTLLTIAHILGEEFDRERIKTDDQGRKVRIKNTGLSQTQLAKLRLAQQFTKVAIQIDEV